MHTPEKPRALLLLGPTASGKTPLGDMIQKRGLGHRKCLHFDFGAQLRHIVQQDCPTEWILRRDIDFLKRVLASGALLEDEHFPIAERILQSFLGDRKADPQCMIVLNGLPRHVGQARAIDAVLHIETVVSLNCSVEVVLDRIRENVGGDRTDREDDATEAVRDKLRIFHQRTVPLIEHYQKLGIRVKAIDVTADMTPIDAWRVLGREEELAYYDKWRCPTN